MLLIDKVIDTPPLPSLPTGLPLFIFRLPGLPSVNDVLYLPHIDRARVMRAQRERAYTGLIEWASKRKLPLIYRQVKRRRILQLTETYLPSPLFVYAEIKRKAGIKDASKGDRTRDIYNPLVKSFIDGCTDANLWLDDSEEHHTDFWIHYGGVADRETVELRIYKA